MTMMTLARLIGAAALALGAAAAQAAGTLTVCTQSSPEGFDIAQYESVGTADASSMTIYDQLIHFKPGGTELMPGLAESWQISADGLVYTFRLRSGVKFHSTPWFKPTRELNADDVLFSINRVNDKKNPAYALAKGGYVYWQGMEMDKLIKSATKVDDHTVRIELSKPEAPFLADMAMPALGTIFSAEYAAQVLKSGQLENFNTQPVGTGPFVFKSYQKDAVVRYSANTAYWGGAPKIDNLIYAVTRDDDTRLQRVKAGECRVALFIKQASAATMPAGSNPAVVPVKVLRTSYLAINVKRQWLGDKRFREALRLALDKPAIVKNVYAGFAEPAVSLLPPSIWSHDASLREAHDVERAKQLVRASGYDGSEISLTIASGRGTRDGELVQADWSRIGIKVRVEQMEIAELLKRAGRGDLDIAFMSWYGDNGDPDNFFTPNLSCAAVAGGGNKSQWCNAEFDALLDQARRTSGTAARSALYVKAQKLIHDEIPLIPVAYPLVLNAVDKRVRGMNATPFGLNDYRAAQVD